MDRRQLVFAALGAGSATIVAPWLESAAAAPGTTSRSQAFSAATELLVEDVYARALQAELFAHPRIVVLKRGRVAATRHAKAFSELLASAGDVPPDPEDFEFDWPSRTFRSEAMVVTGVGVLRALRGVYQTAAATASEPTFRVLYVSLAASVGQHIVGLGGAGSAEPFPVALDIESASDAIERYLG